MAWQHQRSAQRVVIYDVDGDEGAFCAFMERLSKQLVWNEPGTLLPALEQHFGRSFDITVATRAAANGDDIYDVRPVR